MYYRKAIFLLVLNVMWWLYSFFSAREIWYAYAHRGEGDLVGLGMAFVTFPYLLFFIPLGAIQLFLIRKWRGFNAVLLKCETGLFELWLFMQVVWILARP
ncbi:MAG: hypothetical protein JXA21_19195 [Anaerolineae bacterium]|nr:hypothetical protein [Anaerolineae bacterium]